MTWHISANIGGLLVLERLLGADSKLVTLFVVFGSVTFIVNVGAGNGAIDDNVCRDSTKLP